MRYSGIECVACNNTFDEKDDVVVCPVCGAPHHRECWLKENRCACSERHAEGFVWEFPKQATTNEENTPKPQTVGNFVFSNGEGVIICPDCKTPNFENDAFCRKCHKPFAQTEADTKQADNANEPNNTNNQYANNPYANNPYTNNQQNAYGNQPPQYTPPVQNNEFFRESITRFGGLHPESTIDSIPVVEYSDYIGGNTPGKIIRKISFLERYGKKIILHWPPILVGPIWFFYRKMVKEGLVASLILLLCSLLCCFTTLTQPYIDYSKETFDIINMFVAQEINMEEYTQLLNEAYLEYASTVPSTEDTIKNYIALISNYTCSLGVPFGCALLAIKLYRKKIKADIFKIRTQCNDMYTYRNKLISSGGTSPAFAIIGAAILVVAALIRTTLPMLISIFL